MMQACVNLSLSKRKETNSNKVSKAPYNTHAVRKFVRNLPEAIHPKSGIELFGVIPADPAGGYCYRNPI